VEATVRGSFGVCRLGEAWLKVANVAYRKWENPSRDDLNLRSALVLRNVTWSLFGDRSRDVGRFPTWRARLIGEVSLGFGLLLPCVIGLLLSELFVFTDVDVKRVAT